LQTGKKRGIRWGLNGRLDYLDDADDICLLSQSFKDMAEKTDDLQREVTRARLNINSKKMKELWINSGVNRKLHVSNEDTERC
jgi:hypothetical protein